MRTKQKNWSRNSLLISLVVHAMVFIFLALYVTGTVRKVQEIVEAAFVPNPKLQEYEPRPMPVRPILRLSAPQTNPVMDTDIIPVDTLERSSPMPGRSSKTAALPKFSDEAMQDAGSPSSLIKSKIVPRVMTSAEVLPSDVSIPPSVAGGASGPGGVGNAPVTGGTGLGSGGGGYSRAVLAAAKPPPGGQSLSMINIHNTVSAGDGLTDVVQGVTLGRERIPPLPKGQPGGMVIGRGKDIEGCIRFTRLKHRLADWWADPTSMPGVVRWMNSQTKIKADMNIEGGSLSLDDPKIMRCPLAIMTGHDRAIISSENMSGNYRNKLTDQERTGLRRYLLDEGGLLFFDACGHDLTLTNMVKNELRAALPEYSLDRIPNQHELYSCYYDLGGAPPGAYRFWKHGGQGRFRIGKHLEGLYINDRLVAVISNRDYLCAARTRNRPGHGYTGEESPSTYRFLTNVIVYSLTRGGISEHSGYVPELTAVDRIGIDSPVHVPILIPQ